MFQPNNLALSMPDKTIALTYDDGPGPHTIAIAEFLYQRGIRATFFVVGRQIVSNLDTLSRLTQLGHAIGNHTNTHPELPKLVSTPSTLIDEVMETDRLIREFVGAKQFILRAPYGRWSPGVAEVLNTCDELRKYLGPINWDIGCRDYEIGSHRDLDSKNPRYSLEECADAYINKILKKRSGVVLLHDWVAGAGPAEQELRRNNRSLELTKRLVDRLSEFKFAALSDLRTQEN